MTPRSLIALSALLLAACKVSSDAPPPAAADAGTVAPILDSADAVDIHSFARPLEARVAHVSLDLAVDFATKRVGGTATLDIQAKPGVTDIILDDKGLEIEKITDASGKPLEYKVGASDPNLGAPLVVTMGEAKKIVVTYKSAPDAGALQWLSPEQTAGKKKPFLFSQGQSIENRSWIPTQDSPGIRQTWDAHIAVPTGLTAVMSAPKWDAKDPTPPPANMASFSYKMDHSVAPYMIALAVGDIEFRSLGKRTGVWTETAMMDRAASELSDTEAMVDAAEKLYGPYAWGRYDVIVLPPSFPFGGMENPNLTFLTPSFIAGDKSLTSLVAHELAHSWSGNLATNATWADFWLNEGMTTYAERRIVESVYGPRVAAQQVSLGEDAMNTAIEENGGLQGADTRLHIDLKGRHPDDGLTDIAYEKGAAFLRTIEANVGRERFDAWLKGWFDRHRFQPVTSSIFLADIRANLVKGDAALEQKLMLDQWVNQPGIPTNLAHADPKAFADVDAAVAAYGGGALPIAAWGKWTTDERLRFLTRIPKKQPAAQLEALDKAFNLSRSGNSEVRFAYLTLAVGNRVDSALPALDEFLGSVGRGKFVRPLFKALAADADWGRPTAVQLYRKYRKTYHPIVGRDLDQLGLGSPGGDTATDKI